jgi:predicted ABC-type ATPase
MTGTPIPALWITGPAGVGKSTVSWLIFTELAQAGVRVAFADADQLCMCYPAPSSDPGREAIKARNVGALVPRYRAAGAEYVIVNGVLDRRRGLYTELMPEAEVTLCRLRADREELTRRFIGRDGQGDDPDEVLKESLEEADAMDASLAADVCIDTTGVPAGEVAALVRHGCRDWPGFAAARATVGLPSAVPPESGYAPIASTAAEGADGNIVLMCGATGVGKSTAGFQLYLRHLRAGLTAGYIDLDQIGFVRPEPANDPGRHQLKASNLAAMWRTYHAAGARHLIATGPVGSEATFQTYVRALPNAKVTLCRLHAGAVDLRERILSRGNGGSWPQPGDPLRGQPAEYLHQVADKAIADAHALDRAGVGSVRIDTTGRSVAEIEDLLAAATGWPPPMRRDR